MLPMFTCVVNEICNSKQSAFFEMFVNNMKYLSESQFKIQKDKKDFISPYHKELEEAFLNQLKQESKENVYVLKTPFKNKILEKDILFSPQSIQFCFEYIDNYLTNYDQNAEVPNYTSLVNDQNYRDNFTDKELILNPIRNYKGNIDNECLHYLNRILNN